MVQDPFLNFVRPQKLCCLFTTVLVYTTTIHHGTLTSIPDRKVERRRDSQSLNQYSVICRNYRPPPPPHAPGMSEARQHSWSFLNPQRIQRIQRLKYPPPLTVPSNIPVPNIISHQLSSGPSTDIMVRFNNSPSHSRNLDVTLFYHNLINDTRVSWSLLQVLSGVGLYSNTILLMKLNFRELFYRTRSSSETGRKTKNFCLLL